MKRSVTDGMVNADDIWPTDETLKEREREGTFDPSKQAAAQQSADSKGANPTGDPEKERGEDDVKADAGDTNNASVKRTNIFNVKDERLRISMSFFNNEEDIGKVVRATVQ